MEYFNTSTSLFWSAGVGEFKSAMSIYISVLCMYVGLPIAFAALSAVLSYENYDNQEDEDIIA